MVNNGINNSTDNNAKKQGCHIVQLGCGGVGRCVLPIYAKMIPSFDFKSLTVVDRVEYDLVKPFMHSFVDQGTRYVKFAMNRKNYVSFFEDQLKLKSGDMIVDLSTCLDSVSILSWAQQHDVMFVNLANELFDDDPHYGNPRDWIATDDKTPEEAFRMMYYRTLYARQMRIRRLPFFESHDGPTAVLDHGMNPGLVQHFAKIALEEIASQVLSTARKTDNAVRLQQALKDKNHAMLAMLMGLRVIHVSERDTQLTDKPKQPGEFVNTWSCVGLYEEGLDPCQVGWGTHERKLPNNGFLPTEGPKQQVFVHERGINVKLRSAVPHEEIVGYCIPHSEAATLPLYLTVKEGEDVIYRPSVYYVYYPTDSTVASLFELQAQGYNLQPKQRVLPGFEVISGKDKVGVLLIFERPPKETIEREDAANHSHAHSENKPWCYWFGSILDIEEARQVSNPNFNATVVQVACAAASAVHWMRQNPHKGINWAETLDSHFVMKHVTPFLGKVFSGPVEWKNCPPSLQFVDFYAH